MLAMSVTQVEFPPEIHPILHVNARIRRKYELKKALRPFVPER